ncbi:conserved hypothetical protein [Mesorhizobium ventifaucium]|uniref:Uncharacterized protein n=1 Tax=Mesorhizobium ventifaucium TaxID=666020 RepID=A0ABM9DTX2_9HYPH|nr:conserved hypothetical protein [Mesorhizobium ventifaucium]
MLPINGRSSVPVESIVKVWLSCNASRTPSRKAVHCQTCSSIVSRGASLSSAFGRPCAADPSSRMIHNEMRHRMALQLLPHMPRNEAKCRRSEKLGAGLQDGGLKLCTKVIAAPHRQRDPCRERIHKENRAQAGVAEKFHNHDAILAKPARIAEHRIRLRSVSSLLIYSALTRESYPLRWWFSGLASCRRMVGNEVSLWWDDSPVAGG